MEDLHAAGGIPAVLRELRHLLHLDCLTVTGETLGDRIEAAADPGSTAPSSSRVDDPVRDEWRPRRAVRQPRARAARSSSARPPTRRLFEREGRAVVFSSLDDLAARIDDPDLDVNADDFLVLQNAGPTSESAMPEAGYLPIPAKLARAGVKDMVRISDARMSGTAYGTIVLHVAPDAASGGPLGPGARPATASGSASATVVSSCSSTTASSAAAGCAVERSAPARRGYDCLYHDHVLQADQGCDFRFLTKAAA